MNGQQRTTAPGRLSASLVALASILPPAGFAFGESPSGAWRSTFYSAQARANAQANAQRYNWARKQVDEAVAAAEPWVKTSDDELWRMIVPPKLKRSIMVNVNRGCPKCGMGIYGDRGPHPYPWLAWVEGHPWKVQCPNCKELFPKNDFGAFYESGIDPETALFDPARADRRLLFNVDHPDPKDPRHQYAVDDGNGWQRFPGGLKERDWYIGYHAYFGRSGRVAAAIRSLAAAYALTGRPIYAHKCTILLDRLADVFPDYDGKQDQFFNNVSGEYSDGLLGPNYWDGSMWAQRAIDYDMIREGIGQMPETLAFLGEKARRFRVPMPKTSAEDIRRNIERRILVDGGRRRERIWMNGTITEMCQLKVELVLRGRGSLKELTGKYMPAIVPPEHLNADGSGNERSTGYDAGAFGQYCSLIEELAAMDNDVVRAALESYPNLRAAFDFWPDIWCLEKYIPQIGDVGEPGAQSLPPGSASAYLVLFDLTANARYAQVAMRIAGSDASRLPRNIYAAEPEELVQRAIEADKTAGPWHTPSIVKPDYQLGILRSGLGPDQQALWLFYSPKAGTSSHSHFDALNIGLFAFGLPLICEQGYPLYTGDWPARWAWTSNTRSHATVTVDDRCQRHSDGGKLLAFAGDDGVQMMSAEAAEAYENVSTYRRTLAAVEVGAGRVCYLDVFRVKGGREHTYNLPFFYGDLRVSGLSMTSHGDLHAGYVTKVQASPAASPWYAEVDLCEEFKAPVSAHMRIHGTTANMTVLTGQGETRWGKDDPRRLPYLCLRREGDGLESCFALLYEPYRRRPFVDEGSVVIRADARAVHFEARLADGSGTFRLTCRDMGDAPVTVEGTRTLAGKLQDVKLSGIASTLPSP
ncbi:MAG: heparinase II/III domain-containing protein [Phycisphaerae bacterium]